jgi:hypothetical protein
MIISLGRKFIPMQGLVVVCGCDSPEYDYSSIKKSHLNPPIMQAYPKGKNIYPCVLELKNGSIIKITYQSPEENAFKNIKFR